MNKIFFKIMSLLMLICIMTSITFSLISNDEKKQKKINSNNKPVEKEIFLKKHYYAPFGELTTLENSKNKQKPTLSPLVINANDKKDIEVTKCPKVEKKIEKKIEQKKTSSKLYPSCPLSSDLQKHIDDKCKKYNISTNVVIALIQTESSFNVNTMGDQGKSYGLMQIQKRYQTKRMKKLNVSNLLNAYENTSVGIDYLSEIYKSCNGNWHKSLMVYNGGWNYAKRNINRGVYSTSYSRKVMNRAERYKSEKQ